MVKKLLRRLVTLLLLAALVLFGDLDNPRMCNALHALPLRRETWFFSHAAAGGVSEIGFDAEKVVPVHVDLVPVVFTEFVKRFRSPDLVRTGS